MRQTSLEGSFHPPQCVMDPSGLTLAGPLKVGLIVSSQEVDVCVGKPGDPMTKVVLKVLIRTVGVQNLLEGMDLTHNLCNVPDTRKRTKKKGLKKERKQVSSQLLLIRYI